MVLFAMISFTIKNNKGHRVLGEAVDGWRAGNAADTIAVVIISGLPVLCVGGGHVAGSACTKSATTLNGKITYF